MPADTNVNSNTNSNERETGIGNQNPMLTTVGDTLVMEPAKRAYMVATLSDEEAQKLLESEIDDGPQLDEHVQLPIDQHGEQRFELRGELGRGGGGAVFSVYDSLIDREVALKMIMGDDEAEQQRLIQRFVREARVTASLEHPYILPVYELNRDAQDRAFFTMRKAPGLSLDNLIANAEQGQVDEQVASYENRVEIMLRVCEALAFAHSQSVIHQDIKPGNIMLGNYGEVLLVDWGAALNKEDERWHGRLMGTPAYMSPEQSRREGADERSDIYCLGATFYHLLSFRMPTTAESTEEFWERKKAGILDQLPLQIESAIPRFLLDIARKAMATEAADRYQNASEFRDDLLAWRRHRESLAICDEADMEYIRLRGGANYKGFEDLRSRYQASLQLWDGNEQARESLHELEIAYVTFAIEHGDLELAMSLMPADAPQRLQQQLHTLKHDRQHQQKRGKRLRHLAAIFLITVLSFALWLVNDYSKQFGDWQTVFEHDFSTKARPIDFDWTHGDYTKTVLAPKHSESGVSLVSQNMCWLKELRLRGNVRISVTVEWNEAVDAIELFLQTKRADPPISWQVPSGFSCQFGAHRNTFSYISKNYQAGEPTTISSIDTQFEVGKPYTFTLEREDDVLRMYVNQDIILEDHFVLPVVGPNHSHIGLRSWGSCTLKHMLVERLSLPQKSSPLIAADALLAAGNIQEALAHYQALVDDYPQTPIAERALARSCVLAMNHDSMLTALHALEQLRQQFPDSKYIADCMEEEAVYRWGHGERDHAIDIAEQLLKRKASSKVVLRLLDNRPERLPSDQRDRLLALLSYAPHIIQLNLRNLKLDNIAFLKGKKIFSLFLTNNRISDLSPLEGAPLYNLDARSNNIADLSPIAGSRCRRLILNGNKISNLQALKTLPLQVLNLESNQVTDITPLAGKSLEQLVLTSNPIADLKPLAAVTVEQLHLNFTQVSDLSPLQGTKSLHNLSLDRTQVADLSPLRYHKLRHLSINNTKVKNLSALAGMPLESLRLDGTSINDLSPLQGLPLKLFHASYCAINDLTPLSESPIKTLNLRSNQVRAIPVEILRQVRYLEIHNCPITNWSDFQEVRQLQNLQLYTESMADFDFTPVINKWRLNGVRPDACKQLSLAVALHQKDFAFLKRQGFTYKGRLYTPLPMRMTWQRSVALCEQADAFMPMFDQGNALHLIFREKLNSFPGNNLAAWLNAYSKDDIWYWGNGVRVDWNQFKGATHFDTLHHLIWHEFIEDGVVAARQDGINTVILTWTQQAQPDQDNPE